MAEPTVIAFHHKEVVESLLKRQGIHEGIWGIYIKFGLAAGNVAQPPPGGTDLMPSAIIPVLEIGVQKVDAENNISVDAAKVNPRPKKSTVSRR